eukprot:TRINITY_DN17834_c0_g3_i1.p1 TRINITY_DN17834_c0_g3~~TRINITY_DN17834_c0_g3_i1.p1  ORF type:complete len:469 (+),score=106.32 TRINITY_DN17834_c0_g3_i1:156-1409(+)
MEEEWIRVNGCGIVENFKCKLLIPSHLKEPFHFACPDRAAYRWIFHPTHGRHGSARLFYSYSSEEERDRTISVIVCRESQVLNYEDHFRGSHVILILPPRLQQTGEIQGYPKLNYSCENGGIGYARLVIQLFADSLDIPQIFVADDGIAHVLAHSDGIWTQTCFDTIFDGMTSVMNARSPEALLPVNGNPLIKKWNTCKPNPFIEWDSTPHSHLEQWQPGVEDSSLSYAGSASSWNDFSPPTEKIAIVGIRRDSWGINQDHPMRTLEKFKVSKSVYSLILLNVRDTVAKNIFYSPRKVWEDVEFHVHCLEKRMLVIKHQGLELHRETHRVAPTGRRVELGTESILKQMKDLASTLIRESHMSCPIEQRNLLIAHVSRDLMYQFLQPFPLFAIARVKERLESSRNAEEYMCRVAEVDP